MSDEDAFEMTDRDAGGNLFPDAKPVTLRGCVGLGKYLREHYDIKPNGLRIREHKHTEDDPTDI